MTTSPTIDIIVPVWNQPFEARACLASIVATTETARIIIINNGSNRETELVLEEFSDHLGDRALYMTTERNIGFVPAVNRGIARSDADWIMVMRPNGAVPAGWQRAMLALAHCPMAGIISPLCSHETPLPKHLIKLCSNMLETSHLSFAGMMLSRSMLQEIGSFDETLDGSDWCLQDLQQRATTCGYRAYLAQSVTFKSGPEQLFGSEERRRERKHYSREQFFSRWGDPRTYAVYFAPETSPQLLQEAFAAILAAARLGHHFTVFMHHRQHQQGVELGRKNMHTNIQLVGLSRISPKRDLRKKMISLQAHRSELLAVNGTDGTVFPDQPAALPFAAVACYLQPPREVT